MGLCKCPKRKVTNLFCFEHRVNVCEFCLVETHKNCVVQSYLQWLQDSDYDASCTLCEKSLPERETVRLQCLHLFHWDCVDMWAQRLPANTAPAGYQCPYCRSSIFPQHNQVSPLIDQLKEKLVTVNWGRSGMGLPLLPDAVQSVQQPQPPPTLVSKPREMSETTIPSQAPFTHQKVSSNAQSTASSSVDTRAYSANYRSSTPATVLDVDDPYGANGPRHVATQSNSDITVRKKYTDVSSAATRGDSQPLLSRDGRSDADEESNKYKRRPMMQWLGGIWRAKYGSQSARPVGKKKKLLFILLLIVMIIITVGTIMPRLGDGDSSNPIFDPMDNPNIHVGVGGAEELSFH